MSTRRMEDDFRLRPPLGAVPLAAHVHIAGETRLRDQGRSKRV